MMMMAKLSDTCNYLFNKSNPLWIKSIMNFPIPQFMNKSTNPLQSPHNAICLTNVSIGANHMEELKMLELLKSIFYDLSPLRKTF